MKHFLAYGNSDQASFRETTIRERIDYMTVPGTIAAYYPDATAAFVLSSKLDYLIDPRTPLFQGQILQPKASHVSLAGHMGSVVQDVLGDGSSPVRFSASVYTDDAVRAMASRIVDMQRNYGSRADDVAEKLDYYRGLLAEVAGTSTAASEEEGRPPSFVLAPYFASESPSDPWWSRNELIWDTCKGLESASDISAVASVTNASFLQQAIQAIPPELNPTSFFWITGFNERQASVANLEQVWQQVADIAERKLVNLYGSFFSICMEKGGLWGLNNGLGYSESRSWPELSATGAAPARYYVPRLHMYLPPATARLVIESDSFFACDCNLCGAQGPQRVTGLRYHELKHHFVLCRTWEIGLVGDNDLNELANHLQESAFRFETNVAPNLPSRIRVDTAFLRRWESVLRSFSGA